MSKVVDYTVSVETPVDLGYIFVTSHWREGER